MVPLEHLRLRANGISFHALAAGPADGPLALLLHGFPELAISWQHQLPALAAAGFRAVAPDLRGYGGTDKLGPFDLRTLAKDVAELVRACGRERATIIGHDWGGAIAWGTAFLEAAVVERLVVLNMPHPAVFARALLTSPRQLLRSWYMFAFQLPLLPEFVLTRDGASAIARSLRGGSSVRDVWTTEALAPYREAMQQPGAAHAAVDYYRAAFRNPTILRAAKQHPIAAPTKIIWGTGDRFLGLELIDRAAMRPFFAEGNSPTIELVEGAGHFVQNEAAERVNAALVSWLEVPRLRSTSSPLGRLSHDERRA
jgi:pimeloyl-ACP methyl ester carboxylesterase